MPKSSIQRDKVHRPFGSPKPSADSHLTEVDDVIIQVTQAFCPNGHNLISQDDETFDGAPGISLWVSDGEIEGKVLLSPFHGDHNRKGLTDFKGGTRVSIACPECKAQLPRLGTCTCPEGGELVMVYLTENLDDGHIAALCNVWGCHRSKVFDQAQLLSAYIED